MNFCDWISVDDFKNKLLMLIKSGYSFVSMSTCYRKLQNDLFRIKKYAVITFDDGYYSFKEICPWLIENRIPVTLFINGKYLDGISYRDSSLERYLTSEDIIDLDCETIEIGLHGWEHNDITQMATEELETCIKLGMDALAKHPRYIPFWAYTWGRHDNRTDKILFEHGLIPVLLDGMCNYHYHYNDNDNDNGICFIHREIL